MVLPYHAGEVFGSTDDLATNLAITARVDVHNGVVYMEGLNALVGVDLQRHDACREVRFEFVTEGVDGV